MMVAYQRIARFDDAFPAQRAGDHRDARGYQPAQVTMDRIVDPLRARVPLPIQQVSVEIDPTTSIAVTQSICTNH
jgi:hypothetical protein